MCFWYLLIYGVSSLSFNHPWLLPSREGPPRSWEQRMEIPDLADNLKLAEHVRDRLGLMGWPLPWAMSREPNGTLRFEHSRPGRQYRIVADRQAGVVKVEERDTGWRPILGFLHGTTEGVPKAPFTRAWGFYTEITNWFVLFAGLSGIWLWAGRTAERRTALAVLIGSLVLSLAIMGYAYWIG